MLPRLLALTTSHKAEPLLPTLEIFGRLGLRDVDLNLHHIIEVGLPVVDIQRAVAAHGLRVWALAGGWCDFFHGKPKIDDTFTSINRQAAIGSAFGVAQIRLFFGRLAVADYSTTAADTIVANLRTLSDRHRHIRFMFENHDGASLQPSICREVIERVDRPNIRMNFDPINFERVGVSSLEAVQALAPVIGHVHLKGLDAGEFCEFGVGDVDLGPVLAALKASGYTGSFSVEYEGPFDKTLRLYESVKRARTALAKF